ncbi:hypothetical protein [Burkholderia vietnamiensis]|uniref:PD-(D/E)XK nuclease domain-containing protein n=1 Tax=Burkholderia vietnamiensis TaxID=60552 RepID=UPI001ABA15AA|nr:hypothetical protein [Burkholderia vietnamiensis]
MVSVSARNFILREALQSLEGYAEELKEQGTQSQAFYHWVLGLAVAGEQFGTEARNLSAELAGSARSIHALAALGFLLGVDPVSGGTYHDSFRQGVEWLMGRTGNSPASLAALMDPVAQTGVLVGLLACGEQSLLTRYGAWFGPMNRRCRPSGMCGDGWRLELSRMIERRLEAAIDDSLLVEIDSAAATAYVARGLALAAGSDSDLFAMGLLQKIKSTRYADPEEAALDLAAYRYLASDSSGVNLRAPSLDDVSVILQRLSAGMRRWTWEEAKKTPNSTAQKWAIENEYHFQNLLYAVLSPVFPELRDEEWLASVGQKKPRADLVIPSLRTVVEVKYWRVKHPPQDLISQIAEDVSLYLKRGSPYKTVLPVIWDEGRRTEQYDYLTSGLLEIRDVISPIIVPQPAFMVRQEPRDG